MLWNSTGVVTDNPLKNNRSLLHLEGNKRYEIANHLGNVMSVITDRKRGAGVTGAYTYYLPAVLSASDYYAFGMEMRTFSAGAYRYGFNGKENDRGNFGLQLVQDYGFRLYNPAIGKFLSVDPLSKQYPWYTPHQFAGNSPIFAVDLDGLEREIVITKIGKGSSGYFKIATHTVTVDNQTTAGGLINYNDYASQESYRDVGKLQVLEFVDNKHLRIEKYEVGLFESLFGGNIKKGGFAIVTEDERNGKGKENRTALDYEEINLDELFTTFGAAKEVSQRLPFAEGEFIAKKLGEAAAAVAQKTGELVELGDLICDHYGMAKDLSNADYYHPGGDYDSATDLLRGNKDGAVSPNPAWTPKGFTPDKDPKHRSSDGSDTLTIPGNYRFNNGTKDSIVPGTGRYYRETKSNKKEKTSSSKNVPLQQNDLH